MGVSKEGRISEKLSSRGADTSARDSAASSTENGGAVAGGPPTAAGESAADPANESLGGGTAALVAAGGAFVEDEEEEEEDEWDFDRKAQVRKGFPSDSALITHLWACTTICCAQL